MNKEELTKKEIEGLKWVIDSIKSRNEDSGELSFLYYQLHELEKELERKTNKEMGNENDITKVFDYT